MHEASIYQVTDIPRQSVVQAVKDYGKRLFGFVRGRVRSDEDAEDIMQEIWYQLSGAVETTEIEQLSGWLYRVARNKITDKYRKKTTESLDSMIYEDEEGSLGLSEILFADTTSPEMEHLKEMFWEELFTALDELPEAQRQVFVWNELEDQTMQQIADRTGENLKTIISRKGYAVKHLRKRLETLYTEYFNY
ncbi:MAG: polymerase sigma factor [Bacteroidetes bacterium]|nr:polymerase sigma factor [Bacteroidota bacterium]